MYIGGSAASASYENCDQKDAGTREAYSSSKLQQYSPPTMAERAPTPIPSLDILRFKLNTKFDIANQIVEHSEGWTGYWWPIVWLLQAGARWKREEKLGEGGYGEVYLQEEQRTGELRAVKEVKLNSTKYKKLEDRHRVIERELRTMLALRDVSWTSLAGLNLRLIITDMKLLEQPFREMRGMVRGHEFYLYCNGIHGGWRLITVHKN